MEVARLSGPERFRIKIHTECPEEDRDELLDWLRDMGYELFVVEERNEVYVAQLGGCDD